MARNRNPNRDKAFKLYENNNSLMPKKIAQQLNESVENIRAWKYQDRWDEKLGIKKNKRGAPRNNKNALGNNGGAPKGNLNSLKHGLRCDESKRLPKEFIKKWFPVATRNAYEDSINLEMSKLDMLAHSIDTLWAKIIRSQSLTYVKNKNDMTKVTKKESFGKNPSEEYELQFAWDKENANIDIQSKAMERLAKMIRTYEELLHTNWDLATDEQKAKIEVLKSRITKDEDTEVEDDGFIEAIESKVNEVWED